MNKKQLADLGITDEDLQQQIIVMHGKDIEGIKGERDKALADVQDITQQMEAQAQQLETANTTIEGFKKMDIESIRQSADEYKEKYEAAVKEAADQVAQLKFEHALDGSLAAAKAKNVKAVRALLNMEELALDKDGNISGLEDQLTTIKEGNDFLFEPEGPPAPRVITGGQGHSVITDSTISAARSAAGLGSGQK